MTQRAYNVWTAREVEALKRGVQVHGVGFWEQIRNDPQFEVLRGRTGVQLKDKWRNIVKFQKTVASPVQAPAHGSASASQSRHRRARARIAPSKGLLETLHDGDALDDGVTSREYARAVASAAISSALAAEHPGLRNRADAAHETLDVVRTRLAAGPVPDGLKVEDTAADAAPSLPSAATSCDHGGTRVLEDRRYGIYDVRRYVHAPGSVGGPERASHRGSLRSPSDSGSDESAPTRSTSRPGSRRRPRPRSLSRTGAPDAGGTDGRGGRPSCRGCGVVLAGDGDAPSPGAARRSARFRGLCVECEPVPAAEGAPLSSDGTGGPASPHEHVSRVLSAARQLSMDGGLDRHGSMTDSLVLDIAHFMEVLPLAAVSPGSAAVADPRSPLATSDRARTGFPSQPLSPLPAWGTKRLRRHRHQPSDGTAPHGAGEPDDDGRERSDGSDASAARQLAAALPPELVLPPGALLEMYRSLGGTPGQVDGCGQPVDSVALAMRRQRGLLARDPGGGSPSQYAGGDAPLSRHAFQPVLWPPRAEDGQGARRAGSGCPPEPPDAFLAPPQWGLPAAVDDPFAARSIGGWAGPAHAPTAAELFAQVEAGRPRPARKDAAARAYAAPAPPASSALLLEALAAGMGDEPRRSSTVECDPGRPVSVPAVPGGAGLFAPARATPPPLWMERERAGSSPTLTPPWATAASGQGAETHPAPGPAGAGGQRHPDLTLPPALPQDAVAAVMAAMTAWS